jgi:hypothetical protein
MALRNDLNRVIESELRSLVGKLGKRNVEVDYDRLPPFFRERFSSWKKGVERVLTHFRDHSGDARQTSSIVVDLVGHVLVQSVSSLENWRKYEASTFLALGILHRLVSQAALPLSRLLELIALLAYFVTSLQKLVIGFDVRALQKHRVDATTLEDAKQPPVTPSPKSVPSLATRLLQSSGGQGCAASSSTGAMAVVIEDHDRVHVERQLLRVLQILFELPSMLTTPVASTGPDTIPDAEQGAANLVETVPDALPPRLFTLLVLLEHTPGVSSAVSRTADAALERLCAVLFEQDYWRKHVSTLLIEDLGRLLLEQPPLHGFGNLALLDRIDRHASTQATASTTATIELATAASDVSETCSNESSLQPAYGRALDGAPNLTHGFENAIIEQVAPSPWVAMTLLSASLSTGIQHGLEPTPDLLQKLFPLAEELLVDHEPPWPVFALAAALLRAPLKSFASAVASLLATMLRTLQRRVDPSLSAETETKTSRSMNHYAMMLIETFRDALTADHQAPLRPARALIEQLENLSLQTASESMQVPKANHRNILPDNDARGGILTRWVSTLQLGLTTSISLVDDLSSLPSGPLGYMRPSLRQLGRLMEETSSNESSEAEVIRYLCSATLGLLFMLLEGADTNAHDYLKRTWPDFLTAFGAVLARSYLLPAAVLTPLIERGINVLLHRLQYLESDGPAPAAAAADTQASTLPVTRERGGVEQSLTGLAPYETVFICLCRTVRLVGGMPSQGGSKTDTNDAIPSLLSCLKRNLELALRAWGPLTQHEHPAADAAVPSSAKPWSPNTWLAFVESMLALDPNVSASAIEHLIWIVVYSSFAFEQEKRALSERVVAPAICLTQALLTVARAEQESVSSGVLAFRYVVKLVTSYLKATEARALPSPAVDSATMAASDTTPGEEGNTNESRIDAVSTPPIVVWMTPVSAQLWDMLEQFVSLMAATDHQRVLQAWSELMNGIFVIDAIGDQARTNLYQVRLVRPEPQEPLFAPLASLFREATSRLAQTSFAGAWTSPPPVRLCSDLLQSLMKLVGDHGELLTSEGWTAVLSIAKQATLTECLIQTPTAKSDRSAIQEAGFALIQRLANEYAAMLMRMSSTSSCRALWIETLSDWALHADDVNMALSSVGMLWSICDLLDAGERFDAPLWLQILTSLARIGLVDRTEVRNSALKTLLGALLAHGRQLSLDWHWPGIWEEALLPLTAGLLAGTDQLLHSPKGSLSDATADDSSSAGNEGDTPDLTRLQMSESVTKQWNASRLLFLEGLVRLMHQCLASQWLGLETFPSYWEKLLTYWEATTWLTDADGCLPSNQEALLLALVAVWQVMLETLAEILSADTTVDDEEARKRLGRAEQLWQDTWRRAGHREALAYRWPRHTASLVQNIIQALASLRSRVAGLKDAETHRIVQTLCLSLLEVLSEHSAAMEVSLASSSSTSWRAKPPDLQAAVREVFTVLAQWPGDAQGVQSVNHIKAVLAFLERLWTRAVSQTASAAVSKTDRECSVDVAIAQGLLERLARSMPPGDVSEPSQRETVLSALQLLGTYLLGRESLSGISPDRSANGAAPLPSSSTARQRSLNANAKLSTAPNSLVECAVYTLVAIVDALIEDGHSATLLDSAVRSVLGELCGCFLFGEAPALPESFTASVGQLNMIHTGQLEEEKCSIVMLQLAARLGMVDLVVQALGLSQPAAAPDLTWFIASATAFRFNLRLAAVEALFTMAAPAQQNAVAAEEPKVTELGGASQATATTARITARLVSTQVESLYTAYRRRSGQCPPPYLMRMYVEYVLFQARQLAALENGTADEVTVHIR